MAVTLYSRLTSPSLIAKEEADYIFGFLQRNECVGQGLFQFAASGALPSFATARATAAERQPRCGSDPLDLCAVKWK